MGKRGGEGGGGGALPPPHSVNISGKHNHLIKFVSLVKIIMQFFY